MHVLDKRYMRKILFVYHLSSTCILFFALAHVSFIEYVHSVLC
jgi:hypothetical protein